MECFTFLFPPFPGKMLPMGACAWASIESSSERVISQGRGDKPLLHSPARLPTTTLPLGGIEETLEAHPPLLLGKHGDWRQWGLWGAGKWSSNLPPSPRQNDQDLIGSEHSAGTRGPGPRLNLSTPMLSDLISELGPLG